MAAFAGLLSQRTTAGQTLTPLDSGTSSTGSTSGSSGSSSSSSSSDANSATISANDFLELLVTEMQNQDPTDATDPNEYINQLVNVNSLEQLIDINQTLTGAFGTSSTSTSSDAATTAGTGSSTTTPSSTTLTGASHASNPSTDSSTSLFAGAAEPTGSAQGPHHVAGNLSFPAANPAAQRVAHALDGHSHARPLSGKLARVEQTLPNNRP